MAGVLDLGGDVWVTNIPHLWRLRDADGDGVAEEREIMHTGSVFERAAGARHARLGAGSRWTLVLVNW